MSKPLSVQQVIKALETNSCEAGCENTMYAEFEDGVWRVLDDYERINLILAYDPSQDQWFYQKMYGADFGDKTVMVGGRPSKPMENNHSEALSNAGCLYTG